MTVAGITLTWDDADEAENVAQLFYEAALDKKGRVKDHGFWDDYESLMKQIEEARKS